jgi:hypothetical protein
VVKWLAKYPRQSSACNADEDETRNRRVGAIHWSEARSHMLTQKAKPKILKGYEAALFILANGRTGSRGRTLIRSVHRCLKFPNYARSIHSRSLRFPIGLTPYRLKRLCYHTFDEFPTSCGYQCPSLPQPS